MNEVLYSASPDENTFNLQNYTIGELLLLLQKIEGVCAEKSNETRKILWVVSCDGLDLEYFRDTGYIDAINFLSIRALSLANNYAPTLKTANGYFFDVRARFIIESEYESYFNWII